MHTLSQLTVDMFKVVLFSCLNRTKQQSTVLKLKYKYNGLHYHQ